MYYLLAILAKRQGAANPSAGRSNHSSKQKLVLLVRSAVGGVDLRGCVPLTVWAAPLVLLVLETVARVPDSVLCGKVAVLLVPGGQMYWQQVVLGTARRSKEKTRSGITKELGNAQHDVSAKGDEKMFRTVHMLAMYEPQVSEIKVRKELFRIRKAH